MKNLTKIAMASLLCLSAIPAYAQVATPQVASPNQTQAQAQIPNTELFRLIVLDTIDVGVKMCNVQLDDLVKDQLEAGIEIAKKKNPDFTEAQYSDLTQTLIVKLKEDQVSVCHDYESTDVSALIDKVMGAK